MTGSRHTINAVDQKLGKAVEARIKKKSEWYGVDLDGTIAHYDHFEGPDVIGEPIPKMLRRVKRWLAAGKEVRIMTARVSPKTPDNDIARKAIKAWLEKHLPGYDIPITHEKDYLMKEFWDDRAVQLIPNTGERVDGK